MSLEVGQIDLGLNVNENEFNQQLSGIANSAESKATSTFSGLGKKIGLALGISAALSFSIPFMGECLEQASNLYEVQNVVDTTFGSMSDSVNNFAENAMDQFGLSELAAKQMAGTMGAMLKSSGLAQDTALAMSTTLTGLAGDIASFYNISADEAFSKLRSGISGETEPLKQLGINMSVANLEAYALSQGITKSYDSMTQAEQAILRYNYLLGATSDVQGDFAKTSDSWANQTKLLSMRFDELKASIGQGLIKVLTPALELVNMLLGGISNIADFVGGLFGSDTSTSVNVNTNAELLSSPVQEVEQNLGLAADNAKGVADGIDEATTSAKKLKNTLSGFDEMEVLNDKNSGGFTSGALSGLLNDLGVFKDTMSEAYGGVDKLTEKSDELNGLWGDVSLNAEGVRKAVSMLVDSKDLEIMRDLTKEISNIDGFADGINAAKKEIEQYHWLISIGMKLTEEDKQGYINAINTYISESQNYVSQKNKTVQIACRLIFGESNNQSLELNTFYSEVQGDLAKLGEKIKLKVNEAWANDGIIDLDEAKEIQKLLDAQQEIISAFDEAKFEMKFSTIEASFDGSKLDKESYKKVIDEAESAINAQIEADKAGRNEIEVSYRAMLNLGKIDQNDFDNKIKALYDETSKKIASRQEKLIQFKINTVLKFTGDLADSKDIANTIQKRMSDAFSWLETSGYNQSDWNSWLSTIQSELGTDMRSMWEALGDDAQREVKELIKDMEPQEQEYEELIRGYIERGQEVPAALSQGMTDIQILKALSGDTQALLYLMGNQLSDSPEWLQLIKLAQDSGVTIPEQFLFGMNSKKTDLKNGALGIINTTDSTLEDSITVSKYKKFGNYIADGINKGLSEKISTTEKLMDEYARRTGKAFTNVMEIKSPSRLFKRYGGFITDGLNIGIEEGEDDTLKTMNNLSSIFTDWDAGFNPSSLFSVPPLALNGSNNTSIQQTRDKDTSNIDLSTVIQLLQTIAKKSLSIDGKEVTSVVIDNIQAQKKMYGYSPI